MLEFDLEIVNVAWHADATAPVNVVPFDVYSRKFVPRHVALYSVVFFDEIQQVVEVLKADLLHSKVIHTSRQNWIGRHLCRRSPGMVGAS